MSRVRLVIPSYRDASRLAAYLPELARELEALPDVELLVVDDGSGPTEADETRDLVARLGVVHPRLRPALLLERNVGKGGAVYAGWDAAPGDGEWLGFVDADGATPAREVARLLRLVLEDPAETDVLIASRVRMMGRAVERRTTRHVVGRLFATLSSALTGLVIYDSQCGCKFLKTRFYRQIRPALSEMRFAFDIDLLANLVRVGAKIRECPVDWSDVPGSKVSVVRDGLQMLMAILRIRRRLSRHDTTAEVTA